MKNKQVNSTLGLNTLQSENNEILKKSSQTAELYTTNKPIKDITEAVLKHPLCSEEAKQSINKNNRKFYLFLYPSDNLKVKGIFSTTDHGDESPLIIHLRGGNRLFGIVHPGSLAYYDNYNVITTTYRDGVSDGTDEFGGEDINDVKNLIRYIPILEDKLGVGLKKLEKHMIGVSRGALQMFLALQRYPELQTYINKAVAITGLLDIAVAIQHRGDFRAMLVKDFGLTDTDQEQWLLLRNPIANTDQISSNLPLLIVHGAKDKRVCHIEAKNMFQKLKSQSANVTYWEEPEGDHGLRNIPHFKQKLFDWLNK